MDKTKGNWYNDELEVSISKEECIFHIKGIISELHFITEKIIEEASQIKCYDMEHDIKADIYVEHNKIVVVTFKSLSGIKDHIDELTILYRNKEAAKEFMKEEYPEKTRYVIPDSLKGLVMIAYNQKMVSIENNDTQKDYRVIDIDKTGLAVSRFMELPKQFALEQFNFYTQSGKKMRLIPNNNFALHEDDDEIDDMVYVYPIGYNQYAREMVNAKFGRKIEGNVEMFFIGTKQKIKDYKIFPIFTSEITTQNR